MKKFSAHVPRLLHIVSHPILSHHLTSLRSKDTIPREFRWHLKEAARILLLEAMSEAPETPVRITTPMAGMKSRRLGVDVVLVAILRAGLGMIEGMTDLLPHARLGHIGLHRDERTLKPVEYYRKIPRIGNRAWVFLVDPMLATGGSAVHALNILKLQGAKTAKLITLISSREGIAAVRKAHPGIEILTAAIDPILNDKGYIVPGLGDCGDRLFSTL